MRPLLGAGLAALSRHPACRRTVNALLERCFRPSPEAELSLDDGVPDGMVCEDGVCELPTTARAADAMDTADAADADRAPVGDGGDDDDAIAAAAAAGAFVAGDAEEDATDSADVEDDEDDEDDEGDESASVAPPPPDTPHAVFCRALATLQSEASSSTDFASAARLLSRYCLNAAQTPPNPKHRQIKRTNAVFQRVLGSHAAAIDALRAVGFVEGADADGNPLLVIGSADSGVLVAAGDAALERAELLSRWPTALHASLPVACDALADAPDTLERLTAELSAKHIPELLGHMDNAPKISAQLVSADAAEQLIDQLVELREELAANQTSGAAAGGGAAGGAAGASRVRRCTNQEEWYDALLEAPGLVVVDFGAEWCKPCQHVKPLFDELSTEAAYRDVTFLSIDADENPVIIGENTISAFPTFKFFLHSGEEDLPIVGADIADVRAKIDELLANIPASTTAAA